MHGKLGKALKETDDENMVLPLHNNMAAGRLDWGQEIVQIC